jgi:hypothetical protein
MDQTETNLLRAELAQVLARLENAFATGANQDQVRAWKRRSRELRDWLLESENPFVGVRQPAQWVELRPGLRKLVRE